MPITNIRLENYFFPAVNVIANPSFEPPEGNEIGLDIKKNISVAASDEDANLYQVQLDLKVGPKEGGALPYNIHLIAVAILSVEGDAPEKMAIMRTQGAAILYSASREFLLGIMGRGPWKPILLPITIFAPDDIQPSPSPQKKSKKVKPK